MIMEKGMSIGFSGVSGKASSTESDVGLGLKFQSSESFPPSKMMMTPLHHHHQYSQPMIGGDGGGCCPTSISRANEVVGGRYSYSMSHLYHFDHDVSGGGGVFARTLPPFHISNLSPVKSPERGVMAAAATLGFPFTEAQWKELQRQAMIYKYMMSSVPVPPHLLLPIPRNFSSAHSHSSLGSGSILGLRVASGKDAEPGRCKRTDGKKWRCSRDVAPHQKYCERHLHRGRPRSRKPVEVQAPFNNTNITTKKARLHHENHLPSTTPMAISSPLVLESTIHFNENPLLIDKCPPPEIPRGLDWIMEGEMGTVCESEQQWHQLMMQTNIGLLSERSIYREEPLNMISYTEFGAPDLVPLEKDHQIGTPIGFIDAWSNDKKIRNKSSTSSPGNLSPSSLTLSMAMAAGKAVNEEMGQIQMGLGVADSDHSYGIEGADKDPLSPVSWMGCAPGGPLAEALKPSMVVSNGDSISPPATTVSSPSGVLQRTVLSQSDSSGCNSPTLAAATTAPPETIGFKLLS